MTNLIILDRDGVINEDSADYIKSPDEWQAIPGSLAAIATLCRAGYTVAIATNQSGLGRQYYDATTLHRIHQKMQAQVQAQGGFIDAIFYCPHIPSDNCFCRKPKPGLLHQIAQHYNCSLNQIPFVGDSARDIEAAIAVNCIPILVKTGKGLDAFPKITKRYPDLAVYADLAAVAHALCR